MWKRNGIYSARLQKVNTNRENFQFAIRKYVYQGCLRKEYIAWRDSLAITEGVHISLDQLLAEATSEGISALTAMKSLTNDSKLPYGSEIP